MKLIKNYLSMHLKVSLEYKSSFILSCISQALYMLVELFTIYALFLKFKLLNTFDINEMLLGFSTIWLGYSIAELFGRGFDNFYRLIVRGDFDLLLIRPRSIFIQILGSDICYEKVGRTLCSLIIYIYSASKVITNLTILKLLLLILMIVGCVILILSLFIVGASFCFITVQGIEAINIITNGTKQVAEYPMSIYKKPVKVFFTFIIPVVLVNYYPLLYLTDKTENILYVFMPLVSIIFFFISEYLFSLGMKKYCSTGS